MIFETQRLILRPWEETDAPSLYKYASDPLIGPPAGWLPHQDEEDSRLVIRDILSEEDTFALVLKETGEPIGSIGLFSPQAQQAQVKNTELEVGYWVARPYWGQRLVPEALERILNYAFLEKGCTAVWCGYFSFNDKSAKAQAKCGFVYHHTEENVPVPALDEIRTEIFTYLTKEQWMERQG